MGKRLPESSLQSTNFQIHPPPLQPSSRGLEQWAKLRWEYPEAPRDTNHASDIASPPTVGIAFACRTHEQEPSTNSRITKVYFRRVLSKAPRKGGCRFLSIPACVGNSRASFSLAISEGSSRFFVWLPPVRCRKKPSFSESRWTLRPKREGQPSRHQAPSRVCLVASRPVTIAWQQHKTRRKTVREYRTS